MAKQKNTIIYLVAALLFLGGVGYLVYSGLSESSVYFLNVSEAQAADQAAQGNGAGAPVDDDTVVDAEVVEPPPDGPTA